MDEIQIVHDHGASGKVNIIRLKGALTLSTLFAVQDLLRNLPPGDLVIDITGVPYMDSAGLGIILGRWAGAQRTGHKFALTGVSPRIAVLLEMTRVNTLLPMFKTAEDADASFSA